MASASQALAEAYGCSQLEVLLTSCDFPAAGTAVTCAVSGGADSLSLLVLAVAHGLDVEAVHIDHGLREGSAREAGVVREAALRFGARFRSEKVVIEGNTNIEEKSRLARKQTLGPDALTGHTADDQAETLLINLLRGAGLGGLAAMKPGGIHPILRLRRSDTVQLCKDLNLAPVQDPSNEDPRFVRNRVRHELLPLMDAISGRDSVALLNRTARYSRQADDYIAAQAATLDPTDTRMLKKQDPLLQQYALACWLRDALGHPPSSAELERVRSVVDHSVLACEISGRRRITRTDGRLRIEHQPDQ